MIVGLGNLLEEHLYLRSSARLSNRQYQQIWHSYHNGQLLIFSFLLVDGGIIIHLALTGVQPHQTHFLGLM